MGSIRTSENIAKLTKTSTTILSLPASRINIGASQYVTSALTLNTAVVYPTMGGLDASVTAGTLYYVYAVVSSGTVYLIGSTNSSLPSGFTQARVVGGFTTNASSQINGVGEYPGNLSVAGGGYFGTGLTTKAPYNLIINGGFDFWQRNNSFTTNDVYTADRFKARTSAGTYQVSKVGGASPYGQWCLRIVSTDAASKSLQVGTQIEYQNFAHLVGQKVTISVAVKAKDTQPASTDFSLWGYYHTTTADTAIAWGGGGSSGIPGNSTNTISTSISIVSWTFTLPATATSLFINLGNIATKTCASGSGFEIFYVMMNEGIQAAPFQRAGGTVGQELQLCQRYYEKSYNVDVNPGTSVIDGSDTIITGVATTTYVQKWINFSVNKRITPPAITVYDEVGNINKGTYYSASSVATQNQTLSYVYQNTHGFRAYTDAVASKSGFSCHWVADCEL